jgi:hypothetical protein
MAITASQAEMEIVVIMMFLSQMAMLCHVGPIKHLTRKIDMRVDSHAKNNEGGGEDESEIGEKLNRGHYE